MARLFLCLSYDSETPCCPTTPLSSPLLPSPPPDRVPHALRGLCLGAGRGEWGGRRWIRPSAWFEGGMVPPVRDVGGRPVGRAGGAASPFGGNGAARRRGGRRGRHDAAFFVVYNLMFVSFRCHSLWLRVLSRTSIVMMRRKHELKGCSH